MSETTNETATREVPVKDFTIAGMTFQVQQPYFEGHTLTENEATALNGLLGENLRNNFAARIKKAHESLKTGEVLDTEALYQQFAEYAAEYEFGLRRPNGTGTTQPKDPIAREALNMARDVVRAALKDNGYNLKEVGAAKVQELAEALVAKDPRFMQNARDMAEKMAALKSGGLDLGSVSATAAAEDGAASE